MYDKAVLRGLKWKIKGFLTLKDKDYDMPELMSLNNKNISVD